MTRYDDPHDKRLNRRQINRAKREKAEIDAAVSGLLQHPHGRRYLFWLLDIGKSIGANPFTGNALSTSFSCGEQNVGQQIMAHIIEVSPEGFLLMLKERENEKRLVDADAELRSRSGRDEPWDEPRVDGDEPSSSE